MHGHASSDLDRFVEIKIFYFGFSRREYLYAIWFPLLFPILPGLEFLKIYHESAMQIHSQPAEAIKLITQVVFAFGISHAKFKTYKVLQYVVRFTYLVECRNKFGMTDWKEKKMGLERKKAVCLLSERPSHTMYCKYYASASLSAVIDALIFSSSSSANSGLSRISCLTASRPWPKRVSP
ncbi:hypothetical protein SAMN04487890_110207 [Mucilaginibacter polytrichastri]|nr:hypothetical protein SAMN04487890_110207 [Mucilaginibacter polytrichastri]